MKGLDLLKLLHDRDDRLPTIVIAGESDVRLAVRAMKAGASGFIEKPIGPIELLECVGRAFEQSLSSHKLFAWREAAANHISELSPRQHQIMNLVLSGCPSKTIAAELSTSPRTIENHRALIRKRGSRFLPALTRVALSAQRVLSQRQPRSDTKVFADQCCPSLRFRASRPANSSRGRAVPQAVKLHASRHHCEHQISHA